MSISSIVDIVFVALLILLAVVGLYKGFLKSALSMVGSIASFLISYVLAKPFAGLLDSMFKITSKIGPKVTEWLNSLGEFFSTVRSGEEFAEISGEMASGGISGVVQKLSNLLLKGMNIPAGESVGSVLGTKIASVITVVIAGVVAFILIRIILKVLEKLSDKITEVKIFGAIDKILGFIFGLAKGLLYSAAVVVVATIIGYFVPAVDTKIDGIVSETKAFQKYYDYINYEVCEYIDEKLGKTKDDEPKLATELSLAEFNDTKLEGIVYAYYTRDVGTDVGAVYFGAESLTEINYATAGTFFVKYETYADLSSIDTIVDAHATTITKQYQEVIISKTLTEIESLYNTLTHYYVDSSNKTVYFKTYDDDINIAGYLFDTDYAVSYSDDVGLNAIKTSISEYNASAEKALVETVA